MIHDFMISDAGVAVGIACVLILGALAIRGIGDRERLRQAGRRPAPLFRQLRNAGRKDGRRK